MNEWKEIRTFFLKHFWIADMQIFFTFLKLLFVFNIKHTRILFFLNPVLSCSLLFNIYDGLLYFYLSLFFINVFFYLIFLIFSTLSFNVCSCCFFSLLNNSYFFFVFFWMIVLCFFYLFLFVEILFYFILFFFFSREKLFK